MSMEQDPLAEKFRQWAVRKQRVEVETTRMNKLRDSIVEEIILRGDRDEKGNTVLRLPTPVVVGDKSYEDLKREARISTTLSEERALALAKDKGLEAEVVVHTPTIDLDALYAVHADGRLTEAEIEALFDTKVSYAFKPKAA